MTAIDPLAQYRLAPAARPPDQQLDTDTFLQLLVAQLRYQNPLEPQSGTEFLTQTAQFTMVEQLNELATQAAHQTATDEVLTASTMIGREVTYLLDGVEGRGVVTGVRFVADGPVLRIGSKEVPMGVVTSVAAPKTSPTPDSPPAPTP